MLVEQIKHTGRLASGFSVTTTWRFTKSPSEPGLLRLWPESYLGTSAGLKSQRVQFESAAGHQEFRARSSAAEHLAFNQ